MKTKLFWSSLDKTRYECCISVSFFKMIKGGYKQNYIQKFLQWIPHIPKKCFVRMYIDESVFSDPDFTKILELNAPIEIYIFKDKRFLLEDGIHHDGTFGTMARFLPLFDEKLDVNFVWITDMDSYKSDFRDHYLTSMKKQKADVSYNSQACYARYWIPKEVDYPIINDKIIIAKDITISKYKFNKFLKDVYDGKFTELKNKIESVRKRIATQDIKLFTYGFDEYYTNHILYKELLDTKRIVYYNLSLKSIGTQIPGMLKNYKQIELIEEKLWNNVNPSLNIALKKEFEKVRKDIDNEKLNDSYRLTKCLQDFDLYKDKLDLQEKFSTVLVLTPE